SGCSNHQVVGVEGALKNICEAAQQALSKARLSPEDICYTQYGLAGADRQKDFDILHPALAGLPFERWSVVCDTMEGLRVGSPGNYGVVLVCGAGTNAAGRDKDGKMVQTGGLGHFYGDWGGGHDLAKETFRMAIRSWEYRERPSILKAKVAHHLGFRDMEEVFNYYLDHDLKHVPADLTIVLHQAAEEGDLLAIQLLQKEGRELGVSANSVIQRLGGFGSDPVPIVLTGSVLQKGRNPHLLETLRSTIEKENPGIELVIPEMVPVYGSVLLAMDQLGIDATQDVMQKFIAYGEV
ncbi:MAG TPA: BadF/BadG/BcrA/BcrD ATPase family protein, partial [Bacillales bacterium]|nr:BadF/BadG/BcrA/BcrD ATPase family protein [Bacillales bacterium]